MLDNKKIIRIEEIIDFKKPIIYLDIEACRTQGKYNKILQIGAILVEKSKIIKIFNQWSNPEEYIPKPILDLVERKQNFFCNKPKNNLVYKNFLDFIKGIDQIVVFGNFDNIVLNDQAKRYELPKIKLIDIQQLFFDQIIGNKKINISLNNAASALGVSKKSSDTHNAQLDAIKLFKIIEGIKKSYYPDLKKNFLFKMLIPRIKYFKRKRFYYKDKNKQNIDENFWINYVFIKKEKSQHFNNENKKNKNFFSNINCTWKKILQNGKVVDQLNLLKNFSYDNQSEIKNFLISFYEQILEKSDFNCVFIWNSDDQFFRDLYYKKNQHYLEYYYISNNVLDLYLKSFENIDNLNDFINTPIKIKKIFDLMKKTNFWKK